jgi:cytochrome c oxidase assembly factor CtaG
MFRGTAHTLVWLATMAFITGLSLLIVASYFLTWPILRKSPRERRIKATMEFASATLALLSTFSAESLAKFAAQQEAQDGDSDS